MRGGVGGVSVFAKDKSSCHPRRVRLGVGRRCRGGARGADDSCIQSSGDVGVVIIFDSNCDEESLFRLVLVVQTSGVFFVMPFLHIKYPTGHGSSPCHYMELPELGYSMGLY